MKRFENAWRTRDSEDGSSQRGDRQEPSGAAGHYVAPTVVADLPVDDDLFRDEFFVPFVAGPVDSIDEALTLANDTEWG